MRSFRFLLSRRWALFALAVVVLVAATVWLGNWQFDRLDERREDNGIISANEGADPVPVTDSMSVDQPVAEEDEWRRVTATGEYDPGNTLVWRYRTDDDGVSGIDVVVPFQVDDGETLLVDRGWMPVDNQTEYPEIPAPPSGTVTVTAWMRADATGDSTSVDRTEGHLGTRALSSRTAGPELGRDVYQGFVQVEAEDPAPSAELTRAELPELSEGPHFFYGIQWWFFGALAVFGFFYLLWDERRGQRAKADAPPEPSARKTARAEKAEHKRAVREAYQKAYADEKDIHH